MADQTGRGGRDRDGYGDDQGTRVGRPNAPDRQDEEFRGPSSQPVNEGLEGAIYDDDEDETGRGRGSTASGGAAAHEDGRSETGAGREAERSSGERTHEHKGGYGGEGGAPRK